jgi:O-antigen/teichoic acid export membrane protein
LSSVRSNFAANLVGQAWVALIQLLVVPLYLKLLGIEAYGLIGFFVTLQITLQVLDLGLGQTLMREIARRKAVENGLADARSLVRTVAFLYCALAALIGLVVVLAAPVLASDVIHAEKLDQSSVRDAIMLMGLLIPVLWGASLFQGTLMGMERQVLANGVRIVSATVGAMGAVLLLWLVSSKVTVFFTWQLLVGIATWIVTGWMVHRALPRGPSLFNPALLKGLWGFAAGMSGIAVGGVILMQLDKWLLINLLPLGDYGHYILAAVAANTLYLVITPLFSSIFPRMTALHAQGDEAGLARLYHSSAQYIATLALPMATVIALFSEEILRLWTQDPAIARSAAPIVSILVCGTALNGLMNVPYALQLAAGMTGLAFRLVVVKLVLFGPAIVLLTLKFGAAGAATAWLLLNALYVVIGIPLTHASLLGGHGVTWLIRDVLPPAAAAGVAGVFAYALQPSGGGPLVILAYIGTTAIVTLLAAGLATNEPRSWLILQAKRIGLSKS